MTEEIGGEPDVVGCAECRHLGHRLFEVCAARDERDILTRFVATVAPRRNKDISRGSGTGLYEVRRIVP